MERGEVERDPYTPDELQVFTLKQCEAAAAHIRGSETFLTIPMLAETLEAQPIDVFESTFHYPLIMELIKDGGRGGIKEEMRRYNIFRCAYSDLRCQGYTAISRQMLIQESGIPENSFDKLMAATDIKRVFSLVYPPQKKSTE